MWSSAATCASKKIYIYQYIRSTQQRHTIEYMDRCQQLQTWRTRSSSVYCFEESQRYSAACCRHKKFEVRGPLQRALAYTLWWWHLCHVDPSRSLRTRGWGKYNFSLRVNNKSRVPSNFGVNPSVISWLHESQTVTTRSISKPFSTQLSLCVLRPCFMCIWLCCLYLQHVS